MDKMVTAAREIVDDLMKKGYIEIIREGCPEGGPLEDGVPQIDLGEDEFNPEDLSPMEFRCYCDENGNLDDEAIEDDASEFGMDGIFLHAMSAVFFYILSGIFFLTGVLSYLFGLESGHGVMRMLIIAFAVFIVPHIAGWIIIRIATIRGTLVGFIWS